MSYALRNLVQEFGTLGLAKGFNEDDHPRDERGRWTSGDARRVDHSLLDDGDRKKIGKINARIDKHLDAIHEARKQSADHVKALREIQKTVSAHHDKALKALDEHHDILDEYEDGTFPDYPIADDSDEFDRAQSFRRSLEEAVGGLVPEVNADRLRDTGGSAPSSRDTQPPPTHGGSVADDLSRELAALISGARK